MMKKLIFSVAVAAIACLGANAETMTVKGTSYTVTRSTKTLAPGVTYTELLFPGRTYTGYTGGSRVHVVEADLTNPKVEIEMVAPGMTGGRTLANHAATINKTGHQVVAGANANFWCTSETPWKNQTQGQPFGVAISNSQMYTDPNDRNFQHCGGPTVTGLMAIDGNGKAFIGKLKSRLANNAAGSGFEFTATNTNIGHTIDLDQCNRCVYPGTASIYTSKYGTSKAFRPINADASWSTYTGACVEVLCDLAPGSSWNMGGKTKFVIKEIRASGNRGTLGSHDLAIVGRDSYRTVINGNWAVGHTVELNTKLNFKSKGSPAKVTQAVSGNVMPLEGGTITSSTADYDTKLNERTFYATNSAGTKLWIVVCEHNAAQAKKYIGWSTAALAEIIKTFGATDAIQVDCGGSAQMYAGGKQVSQSYDAGGIRSVYNGVFVVSTDGGDGISVDPTGWDFTLTEGNPAVYKDFTVKGTGLSSAITATLSNTTDYSISYPTALSATGGVVRVTYNPQSNGSSTADVKLTSGSYTQTIKITGKCNPKPLVFTEGWTRSEKSGKAVSDKWDATKVRNLAYHKGKLYMVYNHTDILVVDAHNPDNVLGKLKKGDIVKGGTLDLCDVKVFDGKIIACNLATTANNNDLRVYIWDDDTAEPRLLLNTTSFAGTNRLGDCIATKGNLTSGELLFGQQYSTATVVLSYAVTDGKANPNYTCLRLDNADGTLQYKPGASMRVVPDGTGMWVIGKDLQVGHAPFPGQGEDFTRVNLELTQCATTWGNDMKAFAWNGSSYAFMTDYKTQAEAGNTYLGGKMQLIRYDGAWGTAAKLGAYPAAGLSDTNRNTNCASSIAVSPTTGKAVEAWIVCQSQGVAYFINEGGTAPTWTLTPFDQQTPPTPETPTLTANVSSLSMSAQSGATDTKTISVTGKALTADVDVTVTGTDASLFDVTPTSLDKDGGNITVTFRPTAAGTFKANVVLSSEGAASVTIPVTGIGADKVTYADALGELKLVWNFSTNAGNLGSAPWFTQYTNSHPRAAAVIGDNLYVLISKSYGTAETDVIVQLNANTGALKKTINCTGVTGGQFSHGSIAALGDKLILSNQARPTDALKVYEIDPETGAATVILTDATHAEANLGDHVTTYGDATNGRICFAGLTADNAHKVVWYQVANGKVNATANIIPVTVSTTRSSGTVNFEADGTFWLNTRQSHPTHFKADGTLIKTVATGTSLKYGSGSTLMNYGSNKYLAVATPTGTSGNYGNVAMYLMKVTDGAANATLEGTYPAEGLGTGDWSGATVTSVTSRLTGDNNSKADFYVLASKQGIAHYTYEGKSSAVETIETTDTEAPIEFYTLQGIRVNSDNLAPGLYIRRQGNRATKVLVR